MELIILENHIQSNNFLQETVQQLEKDFLVVGIDFHID